jgi:hypothetical protein
VYLNAKSATLRKVSQFPIRNHSILKLQEFIIS